jgi:hypothetical protein
VRPLQNSSALIAKLNPVSFVWLNFGNPDEGFLAHEVQAVCPQAITGEKDAVDKNGQPLYQMIDKSFLIPRMVAAMQEMIAEIAALRAKVGV